MFQSILEWSRRPARRQRTLLPALEPLDGHRLPSAVHLIAPAIPAMVVAADSLSLVRLAAKETTNPGHTQAARPQVTLSPVLPGSSDRDSKSPSADGGSDDDNGASPSNGPESEESKSHDSELIDCPGGTVRKNEVEVELAVASSDPDPLPQAQANHLHAPSSLLADEPTGRRKGGLNWGPLIDRAT